MPHTRKISAAMEDLRATCSRDARSDLLNESIQLKNSFDSLRSTMDQMQPASPLQADFILPPDLGPNTLGPKLSKDFFSALRGVGDSRPPLKTILRMAAAAITEHRLDGPSSYELVRPFLYKNLATHMVTAQNLGIPFTSFFTTVQSLGLKQRDPLEAERKLTELKTTCPRTGEIGDIMQQMLTLHDALNIGLSKSERQMAAITGARKDALYILRKYYPHVHTDILNKEQAVKVRALVGDDVGIEDAYHPFLTLLDKAVEVTFGIAPLVPQNQPQQPQRPQGNFGNQGFQNPPQGGGGQQNAMSPSSAKSAIRSKYGKSQ